MGPGLSKPFLSSANCFGMFANLAWSLVALPNETDGADLDVDSGWYPMDEARRDLPMPACSHGSFAMVKFFFSSTR